MASVPYCDEPDRGDSDLCLACGVNVRLLASSMCATCSTFRDDFNDEFGDDHSEPTGSCDECGTNLYDDGDGGLCDQCAWRSEQGT
jgi:hypothetical protein